MSKCKECIKANVKTYATANAEKIREYERGRANLPHRVAIRREYAQTDGGRVAHRRATRKYDQSEHGKEVKKQLAAVYKGTPQRKAAVEKFAKSERGRAAARRSSKRSRQRYPEKAKARDAVNHEIKMGRMVRLPCEVCGNPKTDAHHDDYSKPLEVRWLCREHHREVHAKLVQG